MARTAAEPRRNWTPPPQRSHPRAADSLDAPAASPVAAQQAWLEARFAQEAEEAPALGPIARGVAMVSGGTLCVALLLAGAARALAWLGA